KTILTEEQRNPQPFNVPLCRLDIKSRFFYSWFEFGPNIALLAPVGVPQKRIGKSIAGRQVSLWICWV
ncbi:MAG: hypothetical protein MUO52_18255, partial [Desulfobacterales bacterium]|nr:hypothetical protein [Desulfobacterales bacterium]